MRRGHASCIALALLSSCAHASGTTRPSATVRDGCRGRELDFDRPPAACVVPHAELATPPAGALAVTTVPAPAHVKSGKTGVIVVELRNFTGAPLTFDVDDSCLAFTAEAESGALKSMDSECGGLCGSAPSMLHVTLEPDGVLVKRVDFEAVMRSVRGDDCAEKVLGPLPAGSYALRIFLPWSDPKPIPGNPDARASRVFEGRLVVEP
jgi:hypothetical protein